MKAHMKCLFVPEPESLPQVHSVVYEEGFLSFACDTQLKHGENRVSMKTAGGWVRARVDVYRQDKRSKLYEARLLARPQLVAKPEPSCLNFRGTIEELFVGGARVKTTSSPAIGSYLKLEVPLENTEIASLSFVAEVLWVKKGADGNYTRLRFHDSTSLAGTAFGEHLSQTA